MRARAISVEEVKRNILGLKGKALCLDVNKGRKKTVRLNGEIVDLFPSVFTFRAGSGDIVSFSYSDVICGDIVFSEGA